MVTQSISDLPMVRRLGRVTETDGKVNLFWTGSGLDFCFAGSRISATFTSAYAVFEQWISVEVDGYFLARMPLPVGTAAVPLLRGLDPGVTHRIRIFKDVQVMPDDPDHFLAADSLSFDGLLSPPPVSPLTIEYVGDSITSGEGSHGARMETDWISPYFGIENNYSRMTSDLLGASFRILSQSGWGVLTDYQNNPSRAIPLYYDQVCGVAASARCIAAGAGEPYDFEKDPADFVIVNLGTNDDGAFHEKPYLDPLTGKSFCQRLNGQGRPLPEDAQRFEDAVVRFLEKIRLCNPHAEIIWCYGMLGTFLAGEIAQAVSSYQDQSRDAHVHFLLLPPVRADGCGARQHPGRSAHLAAAQALSSYIRQLQG